MRLLRALLGAVLWILACLLGLVAVLLCATLILLPLDVPLLMAARRLFTTAVRLMLPRSLAHPVDELGKSVRRKGRRARSAAQDVTTDASAKGREATTSRSEVAADVSTKSRKAALKIAQATRLTVIRGGG